MEFLWKPWVLWGDDQEQGNGSNESDRITKTNEIVKYIDKTNKHAMYMNIS